jgi:hypothetical protein
MPSIHKPREQGAIKPLVYSVMNIATIKKYAALSVLSLSATLTLKAID